MLSEKIIKLCKKAEAFSFYGLIFFFPISIAFSEVFATFTLFFFFVKRWTIFISLLRESSKAKAISVGIRAREIFLSFLRIVKPERSLLSRPLGFFILVCGVSIFFSHYPSLSIRGFFFKVLQWVYLYFVFIEFINKKKHLKRFMGVFFVSITVVFANGLFQYFFGKDFIFGGAYTDRLFSCFRHANDFGAYLVITCPMILSAAFFGNFLKKLAGQSEIIPRILLGVLFLIGYFCLGMTLSRGAWIGFSASMIFLGLSFWGQTKKILLINLFIIIIFFLSFSKVLNNTRNMSFISDDFKSEKLYRDFKDEKLSPLLGDAHSVELVTQKDSSVTHFSSHKMKSRIREFFNELRNFKGSDRVLYWNQATRIIRQSPVVGNGLNTYAVIALGNPGGTGGYPHNCYLQMAAEVGILGLGAFFWAVFILFRSSLKNIRKMKDPFLHCVAVGLLSGLFGFLIHAGFDTNFYSVQLGNLMWVVMGAIVMAQKIDLIARKD